MSAVFEFDDLPSVQVSTSSTTTLEDINESGYSSEIDVTEPTQIPSDEKLYEVPLAENFISSSLSTLSAKNNRKVSLDDFEILKLLGRGA